MTDQTARCKYSLVLPNGYNRERIVSVLNGLAGKIRIQATPEELSTSSILIDLSQRESMELEILTNELQRDYRPAESIYLLEQFAQKEDWKNRARLYRQQNDRQILDAVLKTVQSDTLNAFLAPTGCTPEQRGKMEEEISGMLSRYRWVEDLYECHVVPLTQDIKRICDSNALKVYVDQQEPPRGISSVHGGLLDQVWLKSRYFERLPSEYYPVEPEILERALRAEYDKMHTDVRAGVSLSEMYAALGTVTVERITAEQHLLKKQAIVSHLQSTGLDDLLREETRVLGPTKNPVFSVQFSIADEAWLRAIVKVFDCRNEATRTAKINDCLNEVRAVRYFERVGLLDPARFTYAMEDGIRVIAMRYLDSDNLLDLLKHEPSEAGYEHVRQAMLKGARFHAFGPKTLATDAVSDDLKERARFFAGRITGPDAYYFPNITGLLELNGIPVQNKDTLERDIHEGLQEVLEDLAKAKEFDVMYCDFHAPNWFGRKESDGKRTWTKRDFGTLKIVPAQIDMVTPFVVGNFVRDKREQIYRDFFCAYNGAVEEFNDLVRWQNVDVRNLLIQQTLKDTRKGDHAPEHVPSALARNFHEYLRKTSREDFKPYESFAKLKEQFGTNDEATRQVVAAYVNDLEVFMENMRHKRDTFPDDIDRFLFVAKEAEVKRSLVMSGFFAENARQYGLTPETLQFICTTHHNVFEPLDALANSEQFRRKRDKLQRARDALSHIQSLAEQLHASVLHSPAR